MGIVAFKKTIILLFVYFSIASSLNASVYKTYTQWEVDAIFVSWLINRYVDKQSEFIVVKKGTFIDEEYAINTPKSRFRRGGKETAFESALRQLNIRNNCSDALVPIIRILELAPWRKSEYLYVLNFENNLVNILEKDGIEKVFNYIDNYCKGEER